MVSCNRSSCSYYAVIKDNTMKKPLSLLILITLGISSIANAKEYAGINLCSKTTAELIGKIGETNGGTVKIYEANEYWPGTETIGISNYSIGELKTDIEVRLIKGTVDYIKIESPDGLLEFLSNKYGVPRGPRIRNDIFADVKVWTFSTQKSDPQLLLTLEMSEPSLTRIQSGIGGGHGVHFIYQCKPTIGRAEAEKNKTELEKTRNKLKSSNL